MARDAPAEFVPLFHAAMARDAARPGLESFIKSLIAGEADACVGAYFTASTDPAYRYSRNDRKSLAVFAALAFAAVDRGEPLYAVRFDALVHADKSPWQERFAALDSSQRGKLATRAKQLQKALARAQREILRMLPEVIRTGRSGEMERYVDKKLDFREAHGCLLAYLEASLRYPADNQRSLQVFVGLSVLTIRKGDADFVKHYRRLIATQGTTWSLRWGALGKFHQDMLNAELASRPLKEQLIQAGKAEGKVPVSVVTPSPDRLRADATRRDATKPTNISRKFVALFQAYMTPGGDFKAKRHELTEFIFAQKLPGARECLAAYLEASTRYPANDQQSLYIFWGTASRLLNLGKAYEALKLELLKNTPGTLIAQRFAALLDTFRVRLEGEIASLTSKRTRRILDDLKFEYWKKYRQDADLAALRKFESDLDPSYRDAVRSAARECDRTFNLRDTKAFSKAFQAFSDVMHAQSDPLVLVTMVKWVRELVELTPALRSELYWYGVLALQIAALVRYPEVYDRGLSQEEKEFFLAPSLVPQGYRFDFERRLEFVWWKRASKTQLLAVSRSHALLLYMAQKLGFTLVAMDKAQEIRDKLDRLKAEKSKDLNAIRIPINSRFPDETLTLGATVGNLFIVWWDRARSEVYVEMDGFGRILFAADSYVKLGRLKREDATYGQIWRDTQHLLELIPFFFQIMGYLPDLVSGGFAGLVTSVVTDMMVDVFARQAGLDEKATLALSVAAHLYSGHMLDRMRQSTGTRVLFDPDDIDELYQGALQGTKWQSELLGTSERANGLGAKSLDTGGGGRISGSGGGPRVLEDLEAPEQPRGRAPDASHEERPGSAEEQGAHKQFDDLEEPKPGGDSDSGAFSDRDEGSSKASKTKSDPKRYERMQGDERAKPTSGDPRATKNKGVTPPAKAKQEPLYDLIHDEKDPALFELREAGFSFSKRPVQQPKKFAGAFQKWIGGDSEWLITAPSGTKFRADFLAKNPRGQGLLVGEAKTAKVSEPDQSGHIIFWADKTDPLGRATAIAIESDGLLKVEIVCNVPEVDGVKSLVAPEAYYNVVNQQLAAELIENHGPVLKEYYSSRGKPRYEPTIEEVEKLIDRYVDISDINFGKFNPRTPPRGRGPKRR